MHRPGVELAISRSRVRRPSHYATEVMCVDCVCLVVQDRITHFYNCVGSLMTQQLQSLALESLESFTDLLVQPSYSVLPYEHSGLVVRVLLEDKDIKFEPSFSEFEVLDHRRIVAEFSSFCTRKRAPKSYERCSFWGCCYFQSTKGRLWRILFSMRSLTMHGRFEIKKALVL